MACRSRSAAEFRCTPVCVAMLEGAVPMPQMECERLLVGVVTPEDTAEVLDKPTVGIALLDLELKGSSGGLRGSSDDGAAEVRRRGRGRVSRTIRPVGEVGEDGELPFA